MTHKSEPQTPYEALCKFLPAGTITIPLESSDVPCSHHHATDGWHALPAAATLEPMLDPNDIPLLRLRQLDFLVKHRFIAATCKLDAVATTLFVRIYLIPWDLSGVHGKLRVRDEDSIVAPARNHLRSLFTEIIQDNYAWAALASAQDGTSVQRFFRNKSVSSLARNSRI